MACLLWRHSRAFFFFRAKEKLDKRAYVSQRRFRGKAIKTSFFGGTKEWGQRARCQMAQLLMEPRSFLFLAGVFLKCSLTSPGQFVQLRRPCLFPKKKIYIKTPKNQLPFRGHHQKFCWPAQCKQSTLRVALLHICLNFHYSHIHFVLFLSGFWWTPIWQNDEKCW